MLNWLRQDSRAAHGMVTEPEKVGPSATFEQIKSSRPDYGSQFEILVSLLYHEFLSGHESAIDGGANAGLHAVPLALRLAEGHLHCFEPNPVTVVGLVRNLEGAGVLNRCSVHAQAVGHEAGRVEFLVNDERPATSHVRFEATTDLRSLQVPMVTLDAVVGATPIAFIKLDLEGADFRALQGAVGILTSSKPFVVFENSRDWAAQCYGYTQEEFFAFFKRIGYRPFDLHGVELTRDTWDAKNMAFEFIAAAADDPRLGAGLELIRRFWSTIDLRPPIATWRDCVLIARDPRAYLRQAGWD